MVKATEATEEWDAMIAVREHLAARCFCGPGRTFDEANAIIQLLLKRGWKAPKRLKDNAPIRQRK